jgi:hypothetical protein
LSLIVHKLFPHSRLWKRLIILPQTLVAGLPWQPVSGAGGFETLAAARGNLYALVDHTVYQYVAGEPWQPVSGSGFTTLVSAGDQLYALV